MKMPALNPGEKRQPSAPVLARSGTAGQRRFGIPDSWKDGEPVWSPGLSRLRARRIRGVVNANGLPAEAGTPNSTKRARSIEPCCARGRGGFILVLVLVVIMLASMVAGSLLFVLRAERTASAAGISDQQAWATAMSGVYQAMRIAASSTPGTLDWQDNPNAFRDQLVCDDGASKWYFSVYSFTDADPSGIRYGLDDEGSKLNVNQATEAMLEALPNLTAPVAESIMDFVDADDTARSQGAEQADYDQMGLPIRVPNRALSCVDEVLHVRGFSPQLFYGEDANFNGHLDSNEDDGDTTWPPDNQDGKLDLGLRQYLTAVSYDLNLDNDGKPRLNLNDTNTDLTGLQVPESVKIYLTALWRNQQSLTNIADLLEATGKFRDEQGADVSLQSGVGKAELAGLLDRCTATNQSRLPGLVNLNTAPSQVLATLPGLDQSLAESIVSARVSLSSESRRTPAWLYEEGLVNADQFKKIAPYLTTRSYQFQFHVLAYPSPAGPYRVLEVIIDTAVQPPAILSLRDLTRFKLPFAVTPPDQSGTQASPIAARAKRPNRHHA
jgi:type II secretory pathway component PulK